MYEYKAKVLKVVDGDTLHVQIDLGMDIRYNTTIRLYGVNTPEMGTAEGKAAKQYVIDWLTRNCPDNIVTLLTFKDKREKYGRYLGKILCPYDPTENGSLNGRLVADNFAVTYLP